MSDDRDIVRLRIEEAADRIGLHIARAQAHAGGGSYKAVGEELARMETLIQELANVNCDAIRRSNGQPETQRLRVKRWQDPHTGEDLFDVEPAPRVFPETLPGEVAEAQAIRDRADASIAPVSRAIDEAEAVATRLLDRPSGDVSSAEDGRR